MRVPFVLTRDARPGDDLAIRVVAPGAVEIYWDGELIGGDGVVGTDRATEVPGRHGVWASLTPRQARQGQHLVAVRVSSFHMNRIRGVTGVQLARRAATERRELQRTAWFLFAAGLLIFAGAVHAMLYRSLGSPGELALFAALTLLVALLLVLEYGKYLYAYPYTWHMPRLLAISLLTAAIGVLLPLFVSCHLGVGRPRWIVAGLTGLFVLLVGLDVDPDVHSLNFLRGAIITSVGLAAVARVRRHREAGWVLAACAANLPPALLTGFRYADHWFFIGFLAMVWGLVISMGRRLRRQSRERQEALLRIERLRFELLRKSMQPHFLMNSLAVAISQIQESPARGIELLRSLARELELVLRMSERDEVSLGDELEVCRMHAATMEHLLEVPLDLSIDQEVAEFYLPPGVLLTLIENAITHGRRDREMPVVIRIQGDRLCQTVTLENPLPDSAAPHSSLEEGAGLRFVRAQLERDCKASWEIKWGPDEQGGWLARLTRRPYAMRSRSAP